MTTLAGALGDKAKVFKSELGTSGADTLLQSVLCVSVPTHQMLALFFPQL